MKLTLIVFALMLIGFNANSQIMDSLEVAYSRLIEEQVNQAIEQSGYVRIPNKDFDDIIENKIITTVDSKIKTLIGFLVAVIGILSAFSIIQTNRSKNILKEQVLALINSELNSKIVESRNFFEDLINSRLNSIEKHIKEKTALELKNNMENIKDIETQLRQSNTQIDRAEEYLLNIEFEELRKQIRSGKYVYELTLERTIDLLKNAEDKNKEVLIPQIINLLTIIYYEYRKYNEVTNLLDKYEGKVKLISTSYINAALTALSDYHYFNSFTQREKALDYLNKSLELTQGYGQAQALKLEIFMMDYLRSEEEEKKKMALHESKLVINDLLKSESSAPSYETINRLNTDSKIEAYKKYVDLLYNLFPEELKQIHQKAESYFNYLSKHQNKSSNSF